MNYMAQCENKMIEFENEHVLYLIEYALSKIKTCFIYNPIIKIIWPKIYFIDKQIIYKIP